MSLKVAFAFRGERCSCAGGSEHTPFADKTPKSMLVERADTVNTGDAGHDMNGVGRLDT